MKNKVTVWKDTSANVIFKIKGPIGRLLTLQAKGLGVTPSEIARATGLCLSTVYRRLGDTNSRDWGTLRTNIAILQYLKLQQIKK